MKQQHSLMTFDPATGEPKPYPSHADQWREWHGKATAWLFNPWTGTRRDGLGHGPDRPAWRVAHDGQHGADLLPGDRDLPVPRRWRLAHIGHRIDGDQAPLAPGMVEDSRQQSKLAQDRPR